jgi:hypothetical protein
MQTNIGPSSFPEGSIASLNESMLKVSKQAHYMLTTLQQAHTGKRYEMKSISLQ